MKLEGTRARVPVNFFDCRYSSLLSNSTEHPAYDTVLRLHDVDDSLRNLEAESVANSMVIGRKCWDSFRICKDGRVKKRKEYKVSF